MNQTNQASLAEVVPALCTLFEMFRNEPRKEELELELRFGSLGPTQNFVSGVSREFMEVAICRLQTNAACKSSEWNEHEDYFYNISTENGTTRQVRTRVTFDAYEFGVASTHSVKRCIASVTLKTGEHAIRLALSRETPVPASQIPMHVNTSCVRIQQRKSIQWARTAGAKPPWCYEFSMTWSGKTKSDAETTRACSGRCNHEFEIELDLNNEYVRRHSDDYLARSILLKATDFIEANANLVLVDRGHM